MKEVAIITGASGGIGYEIAWLFAKKNIDILLVARNKQKLDTAKNTILDKCNINVFCVDTDLSLSDGCKAIYNCVEKNHLTVTYLVNNAGFGDYGLFTERSMEKYSRMLSLNKSKTNAYRKPEDARGGWPPAGTGRRAPSARPRSPWGIRGSRRSARRAGRRRSYIVLVGGDASITCA